MYKIGDEIVYDDDIIKVENIKQWNNGTSDYLITSWEGRYYLSHDVAIQRTKVHKPYQRRNKINSIFNGL